MNVDSRIMQQSAADENSPRRLFRLSERPGGLPLHPFGRMVHRSIPALRSEQSGFSVPVATEFSGRNVMSNATVAERFFW
jgi:hypothetical protein